MYSKPGTPVPSEEEFGKLFLQTEIIASMAKTNRAFFGRPKHFTMSFENSDLCFSVLSEYGRRGTLAIQIVQPYQHEEIVSGVGEFLTESS